MNCYSSIVGLVTFAVICQLTSALFPPILIRKCVDSSKVQAADLALFYGTDYRMVTTPVKCYLTCVFESSGFVMNGKVSDDFLQMAKSPEEAKQFQELSVLCSNSVEGECETTYQAFKCWVTKGIFKPDVQ